MIRWENRVRKLLELHNINQLDYSIGSYAEERLCLEKNDADEWIIYIGERGEKNELYRSDNLNLTIGEFFNNLSAIYGYKDLDVGCRKPRTRRLSPIGTKHNNRVGVCRVACAYKVNVPSKAACANNEANKNN